MDEAPKQHRMCTGKIEYNGRHTETDFRALTGNEATGSEIGHKDVECVRAIKSAEATCI